MLRSPISYALWLLGRRGYSKHELKERLLRHFDEEIAGQTIAQLERQHLVDDTRFTEQFVAARLRVRHYGRYRIGQELRQRGVDKEISAPALESVTNEAEEESARELLARRLKTWHDLPYLQRLHRSIGLLSRRGYGAPVIKKVTGELVGKDAH